MTDKRRFSFKKNLNPHIRRFEFKYLVAQKKLDKIRQALGNFVEIDPSISQLGGNFYPVTSLYFDDHQLSSYWEKMAGVKSRKKHRLRIYDVKAPVDLKVFMEIKKRNDAIVFKDRYLVNLKDLKLIFEEGRYDLLQDEESDVGSLFVHTVKRKRLEPTVLVSYRREAYFDRNNSNFRVTLDQDLRAARRLDFNFDASDCKVVLEDYAVVEAKFNRVMPAWFGTVIKSYNLNRVSFSKYCFSLESCGIVNKSERSYLPQEWTY